MVFQTIGNCSVLPAIKFYVVTKQNIRESILIFCFKCFREAMPFGRTEQYNVCTFMSFTWLLRMWKPDTKWTSMVKWLSDDLKSPLTALLLTKLQLRLYNTRYFWRESIKFVPGMKYLIVQSNTRQRRLMITIITTVILGFIGDNFHFTGLSMTVKWAHF